MKDSLPPRWELIMMVNLCFKHRKLLLKSEDKKVLFSAIKYNQQSLSFFCNVEINQFQTSNGRGFLLLNP